MGFFYFDESIQQRAEFIIGAFVYSEADLTPAVLEAITPAGLKPVKDLRYFRRLGNSGGLPENPRVPSSILGLGTSPYKGLSLLA